MMTYSQVVTAIQETDENLLNLYQYGSRVYGTATARSDWDFVGIVSQKMREDFLRDQITIHFFTPDEFHHQLSIHEISALECLYLPDSCVWKSTHPFTVRLDYVQLRHSLSAKSSNSWVKCKKKLTLEKDYDLHVGRKSMFHAFRIILYGIQLCQSGRITDYAAANEIYEEICQYTTWNELSERFKPRYNQLLSTFRILAPKV
jgi:hypothetical protein